MKPWWPFLRRLSAERLVPWATLLPVPGWFLFSVLFTAEPAWRAVYRAGVHEPAAWNTYERELSHTWSGKYFADVPADLDPETFVAEFDACLTQERELAVPFMLVADGTAQFFLDGALQLTTPAEEGAGGRRVSGKVITLSPGRHHLRVEFRARRRPRIGLLASFDGAAPRALASGNVAAHTTVVRSAAGSDPCGD